MELWNRAALLKHIWHICTDNDQSIWSSWVRSYLIKKRHFWELKNPGECSWAWRKILKLRDIARGKMISVGGDGRPKMLWLGSPNGTFSVSRAWEDIRNRSTQVPWYRVVWFKDKVPRHALILWLAVKKGDLVHVIEWSLRGLPRKPNVYYAASMQRIMITSSSNAHFITEFG